MNYIAHHGIKGQRWGVRRYQNEDGSLTPEGRRHYYNYYVNEYGREYRALKRENIQNEKAERESSGEKLSLSDRRDIRKRGKAAAEEQLLPKYGNEIIQGYKDLQRSRVKTAVAVGAAAAATLLAGYLGQKYLFGSNAVGNRSATVLGTQTNAVGNRSAVALGTQTNARIHGGHSGKFSRIYSGHSGKFYSGHSGKF